MMSHHAVNSKINPPVLGNTEGRGLFSYFNTTPLRYINDKVQYWKWVVVPFKNWSFVYESSIFAYWHSVFYNEWHLLVVSCVSHQPSELCCSVLPYSNFSSPQAPPTDWSMSLHVNIWRKMPFNFQFNYSIWPVCPGQIFNKIHFPCQVYWIWMLEVLLSIYVG